MQEIGSKIREMRAELYDVVNEVCNQMRLLRNEIVELQHAIYSLDRKQKVTLPVEPKQPVNTKFSVQEVLK